MFTYSQTTGRITQGFKIVSVAGYSGRSDGRNNPAKQNVPNLGPIPQGAYRIGPANNDHPKLGPLVMELTALPGTDTFGRSAFFIHGNNAQNDASHGCIILGKAARQFIADSGDTDLTVVA